MAEFKFDCPSCNQSIICDELWSGHQIQCPACQAELTVPGKPAPAPQKPSLVPQPPSGGGSKLSLNRPQHQPSAAPTVPRNIPGVKPPAKPPPKKSPVPKIAIAAVLIAALGVGGYFGYGWLRQMQEKANEKRRAAEKNSDGGEMGHIANLYNVLDATDPDKRGASASRAAGVNPSRIASSTTMAVPGQAPTNTASATDKQLPIIPPVWTLDIASAKIPEGQANGKVAGTNFVVETARLDRSGTAYVLSMRQGTPPSGDEAMLVYLHLAAGETLTNHTWTISQDMKGAGVPQVLKLWKPNPKYAPQQASFSTGYAMKLQLGNPTDGIIPVKIFLAVPDNDQSVVAGLFRVNQPNTDATIQPAMQPVAAPVGAGNPAEKAAFDKRYGIKR